eukprot:scaffold24661_cov132-Cylindrotheca_fusiformis.AAC.2
MRRSATTQRRIVSWKLFFLFCVLKNTLAREEHDEQPVPSDDPTTMRVSESFLSHTPSISPSNNGGNSSDHHHDSYCINTPGWEIISSSKMNDTATTTMDSLFCDDVEVTCDSVDSSAGLVAKDHCCKCKFDCCGTCNVPCIAVARTNTTTPETAAPTTPRPTWVDLHDYRNTNRNRKRKGYRYGAMIFLLFFVVIILCCRSDQQRNLRRTRRTMVERRRRQQQAGQDEHLDENGKVSAERYQQFVSRFEFYELPKEASAGQFEFYELPSRIEESGKQLETTCAVSSVSAGAMDSDIKDVEDGSKNGGSSSGDSNEKCSEGFGLDECCICLDGYSPGETMCRRAAKTCECKHVFHHDCAVEWFKAHSQCPLCRIDLMK